MDLIKKFNLEIGELINKSNIPISVIRICLQNYIYQLDILELQNQNKVLLENNDEAINV